MKKITEEQVAQIKELWAAGRLLSAQVDKFVNGPDPNIGTLDMDTVFEASAYWIRIPQPKSKVQRLRSGR